MIEGESEDVDEFVTRMKALRWQALQVRGEERIARRVILVDENGAGAGVTEVEGLGDVVERLKKFEGGEGVGKWFLEVMKIA